jgi:hypothetical protein
MNRVRGYCLNMLFIIDDKEKAVEAILSIESHMQFVECIKVE